MSGDDRGNVGETRAAGTDRADHMREELERVNAQIRHLRSVAANLMESALKVWAEISQACEESRNPEEILDDNANSEIKVPVCGWPELREKLYLLRHYLDYAKRLCNGSI